MPTSRRLSPYGDRVAQLTVDEGLAALLAGDRALTRDPQPLYRRLRAEGPVHLHGSVLFVASHAAVKSAYRDSTLFASSQKGASYDAAAALLDEREKAVYGELLSFEQGYLSRKDGTDHARLRATVQRAFTPKKVAELGEVTQRIADELLSELAGQERPDFMQLALRLPLLVILELFGVPRGDAADLKRWGDEVIDWRSRTPVEPELIHRAERGLADYRAHVMGLIERARQEPGRSDLVASLLAAEESERLTTDELVANMVLIFFAGHETTANLLGSGLYELLRNPDQWERLLADPSLVPSAVEELLRVRPPARWSPRRVATDVEIAGVHVPRNTRALLMIDAANRDAEVFPDPDRLDVARRPNDHLSLGHGMHFCLGGPLARLEGQIVFSTLVHRFPDLAPGCDLDALEWGNHPTLPGLTSLPVSLGTER